MPADRTGKARPDAHGCVFPGNADHPAPRAAFFCRPGPYLRLGFALFLLTLGGIWPAVEGIPAAHAAPAAFTGNFSRQLDHDGNGIEDLLDRWLAGKAVWADLQEAARPTAAALDSSAEAKAGAQLSGNGGGPLPASSVLAAGRLRVLCLGATAGQLTESRAAAASGVCRVIHDLDVYGGVTVLDVDAAGLAGFLASAPAARVMLDRDGVPALVDSRKLVGVGRVTSGTLDLGNDWSATVAILDSGLDSAHGDLGDSPDDDIDGPAPAVGDAGDWFAADGGWPLFSGYKVVGWHDVTDDFPAAQGPWDYHYHGTALASVVAGSGTVDPDYRGVAPGARLTVVKCYDFDQVWHAWAGDFLAACAWTLAHRDVYRVRTVLVAVNWDVDAGISTAMAAFVDAGMLPVAAMGNFGTEGSGPGYPAVLPDVLTAGAVDAAGAVSAYSGRGLTGDSKPDLVAPGGGLLPATGRIVAADIDPDDSYSGRFGTSLAAAHLAGAAHILDEAMLENGIVPAQDRAAVKARQSILKLTTAFVGQAETADGSGIITLPGYAGHDPARGFGHLRVDAAARAVIDPLLPGQDQTDTLSSDWRKPVITRRLVTSPGVRYLIEAVPLGNVDVSLEIVDVAWQGSGGAELVTRMNLNGVGVSEFAYFRPGSESWSFLTVKRIAGSGGVVLKIREADTFTEQSGTLLLPGLGTGAPNAGNLVPFAGPSLVVPSRVLVDPVARSLNVLDLAGNYRAGWPVFVFPASSSQGGLTQPMVTNLDGVNGDEIVVASEFGSVYFFKGDGAYRTVNLSLNRSLTAPVAFRNAVGGWRVLVVDKLGWARTWSWNASANAAPELKHEVLLGHELPLAPAAGLLTANDGESVVVSFADGWVGVLDENLNLRPGWPQVLGSALETAPVLVDLDGDNLHEIVVPVRDAGSGQLVMRVFDGDGSPLPSDGTVVPAPRGGSWLRLSGALVAGRYGTGELHVAVAGLAENGLPGSANEWSLGIARLFADGGVAVTDLQGFTVRASTEEGELQLDQLLLPAPLAWNQTGGQGIETATLFHIKWQEQLYGLTSLPGATTGWLLGGAANEPLIQKQPLLLGGSLQPALSHVSGLLVPVGDGVHMRVEVVDRRVGLVPVLAGQGTTALWRGHRSDGRNSGSYPLETVVSAVPAPAAVAASLRAYPNPGSGRIRFNARSGTLPADAQLEIFDLRGHRVRRLSGADAEGTMAWDGADGRGRPLAAGTYLAVVQAGGQRLTTRVVLTR